MGSSSSRRSFLNAPRAEYVCGRVKPTHIPDSCFLCPECKRAEMDRTGGVLDPGLEAALKRNPVQSKHRDKWRYRSQAGIRQWQSDAGVCGVA